MPTSDKLIKTSEMYLRIYGNGYPLLMLHGNHGSGKVFAYMVSALKKKYMLIIPDLPLHGEMKHHDLRFKTDPDMSVEYFFTIMDYLNIRRFDICGHSIGGMIALLMCIKNPKAVNSLILLDSYVKYNERPPGLLNFYYPGTNKKTLAEIQEALSYGEGYTWYSDFDVSEDINKVSCPVLELFGESNPSTDDIYINWISEKRKGMPPIWRCERIGRAGHFLMIDRPELVNELIINFLDDIHG